MKKIRVSPIILSVIFILTVSLSACAGNPGAQNASGGAGAFETEAIQRGDLAANVIANGSVRPNRSYDLTRQAKGTVEKVEAQVGDSVKTDQELAVLSNSSLPQTILQAQIDLVTAQRALDDLLKSNTARAQAELARNEAQKAANDAVKKRQSKSYARASENTIDVARANYIMAEDDVKSAEDMFDRVKSLGSDSKVYAAALAQMASARQTRDNSLANLRYAEGLPDSLDVSTADAQLKVAQAKLEDAEREWERLKDGPDPDDVNAAKAKIAMIQETLDQARLTAPFDSVVTNSWVNAGDLVNPNTSAFHLEDRSHIYVDVSISEVDINRIQVGQDAVLTFDSVYGKEYHGKVSKIGTTGVVSSGVVNFPITVELTDADDAIKTAMTSTITITVEQIKSALLVPNKSVRTLEGKRVVFVMRDKLPVQVEVKLGTSSDTMSEILSGDIKEGDLVVTNPDMLVQSAQGGMMVR